jgi:HipA-like protein
MIRSLSDFFWKQDDQEAIVTPQDATAHFVLSYKNIKIGDLQLVDGIWHFSYDRDFDKQNIVTKLIDFPDTQKKYTSKELWPFFLSRIPGLGQPKVQKMIKENNIDRNNQLELLRFFGANTLSNPFVLHSI